MARGLSCFEVCGIFPDQGLNHCPLYWQADSYPLYQGCPVLYIFVNKTKSSMEGTHYLRHAHMY